MFSDLREWGGGETLNDFLARTIAAKSHAKDEFRMPRSFKAWTFARVAGINIQWTLDLASHLEVTGDVSDLAVFHSVTVIDLSDLSALGKVFPTNFLDETRGTLSLLLPTADARARSWFRS